MFHMMKYRFLSLMREKVIVFWSMLFPILLGSLFYVSFGSADYKIETIKVGVVEENDSAMAKQFMEYINMIEDREEGLIELVSLDKEKADEKLKHIDVSGVYYVGEDIELVVTGSNIGSNVMKSLLDTFNRQAQMYMTIAKEKPSMLVEAAAGEYIQYVKKTNLAGKEVNSEVQYFLSLIALGSMFGGFIGYAIVCKLQANVSDIGIRRAVTCVNKFKQIAADGLVGVGVQYFNLIILMLYLNFVLKIDLGDSAVKLMVIGILGDFIGVGIGIIVGSLSKLTEGMRIGIIITTGLVSSFMAGLMVSGVKRFVELRCPLLNRINPAAVIADAIYSASVYDDVERYGRNIMILLVMVAIIIFTSFLLTRRVRYDSI